LSLPTYNTNDIADGIPSEIIVFFHNQNNGLTVKTIPYPHLHITNRDVQKN
jgi:hypothetical protein